MGLSEKKAHLLEALVQTSPQVHVPVLV